MRSIATLLLCIIFLSGCISSVRPETHAANPTANEIEKTILEPNETFSLHALIYCGNENADGFLSQYVPIDELNTAALVRELINSDVLSPDTEILSEELIEGCLHLDFNETFRTQICSTGTSGEYIIMGCLVNTLLDNLGDTVQSVYITVNGEILESGHVIYDFEMSRYN